MTTLRRLPVYATGIGFAVSLVVIAVSRSWSPLETLAFGLGAAAFYVIAILVPYLLWEQVAAQPRMPHGGDGRARPLLDAAARIEWLDSRRRFDGEPLELIWSALTQTDQDRAEHAFVPGDQIREASTEARILAISRLLTATHAEPEGQASRSTFAQNVLRDLGDDDEPPFSDGRAALLRLAVAQN